MNWEAVVAISTAFTGVVILITAIAAIREVRVAAENAVATREQLEHLRKATQFDGALAVFAELDSPRQVEARHFVQYELPKRLADGEFAREVELAGFGDETKHKELDVLRCFERIGSYVSKGWVDGDTLYMVASGRLVTQWIFLEEVVAIHRKSGGKLWPRFEQLVRDTKAWQQRNGIHLDDNEKFIRAHRDIPKQ
jgi:hypothetical protein